MGRWANYPTTVNELRSFDINFLTRFEYLQQESFKGGSIVWTSSNGNKNSIGITVKTYLDYGYLIVDYVHNKTENINYKIQLITRPSNLGIGLLWFFVCPFTGKVCRKLHLINGYFKHRTANSQLMYTKQLESKRWREWTNIFADDSLDEELYSKYFKRYYKGKITKRYARILKMRAKLESKDPRKLWEMLKCNK